MAFLFVDPKNIEIIHDDKTGEIKTWRLNCTELSPRNFNVNLIKHSADVKNQLQQYVDSKQPIMMPIKEGKTSDGQAYFQLEAGDIIPVSREYAKAKQQQQQQQERSSAISPQPKKP